MSIRGALRGVGDQRGPHLLRTSILSRKNPKDFLECGARGAITTRRTLPFHVLGDLSFRCRDGPFISEYYQGRFDGAINAKQLSEEEVLP